MVRSRAALPVEEVTRSMRDWIVRAFQPGDSLPGDRELSRRFGVSNVTIGKAMQVLVAEGLVERRPRSGTYMLDWRENLPVALVTGVDLFHPGASNYFRRIIANLRNRLRDANISQELFIGHSDPGKYCREDDLSPEFLEAVDKSALRAVILVSVVPRGDWLEKLKVAGIPVIGMNPYVQYGVFSTSGDAIRRSVRHLYAQGCRRFAMLVPRDRCAQGGPDRREPRLSPDGLVACKHFAGVLAELGLEKRDEWIGVTDFAGVPGAGWEETREIWIAHPEERPDALIVMDEALFNNVAVALLEMNVDVPRELHVVTNTSAGIAHRLPFPVSRIEIDSGAQSEAFMRMLREVLGGNEPRSTHIDLPAKLKMLEGNVQTRDKRAAKR
ncbi:MAG: substrate-binding domain-containing protein [Candidatus Pacebacteria bacterium]|nr:substrate-binding domain-containing protein [Candidatus Paceibacterota bacterium]